MGLTKIDDRGLKTPIDLLDNEKIRLGTGNDFEISYNGTNTVLAHTANSGAVLIQAAPAESAIRCNASGSVDLYYDNNKKLQTTANGIEIIAAEGGSAGLYLTADEGDDNGDKWSLYADDGSTISLVNYASGSWEKSIECNGNGNVELYYDNSLKFETTSSGTRTTGAMHINDGSASGNRISVGNGGDLKIFHTNPNTYIQDSSSALVISSARLDINNAADNEQMARFTQDGAVELYHDNVKMFETYNGGVWIPDGTFYASGADKDVAIGHNTTNYITYKNADLLITGDASNQVKIMPKSNETAAVFKPNDSVELYYNNSLKAETTSVGFNVQGVATQETTGDDVVWGRQVFRESIAANATKTFTVTGLAYGNATITIGLADGNYHYAAFSAILGGMMYSSGNAYVANVLQNDRSGVNSITVTKNNASYVIAIQAGTNQVFGSIVLESNSYNNGGRPTLTIS